MSQEIQEGIARSKRGVKLWTRCMHVSSLFCLAGLASIFALFCALGVEMVSADTFARLAMHAFGITFISGIAWAGCAAIRSAWQDSLRVWEQAARSSTSQTAQ